MEVLESQELAPFYLTHIPDEHKSLYNLAGHIHPAVRLRGKARSYIKLPCFYFDANRCILPSFGTFTGSAVINPKKGDFVYAVLPNRIVKNVSL